MNLRQKLTEKNLIPLSKYWLLRLGFLDIINGTDYFIHLIEDREDIGDDAKRMIKISKEWETKDEHNVGEGGALLRYLQFASWKFNLNKKFVKEGTLKNREINRNPEIVHFSLKELLNLENKTIQWASVAILLGNNEDSPDDYFLNLSKEALEHYEKVANGEEDMQIRLDETIFSQALAFIEILRTGKTNYYPNQQDEYCFSRAFGIISKAEGENRWPELRGHESDRIEEMEKMIDKLSLGQVITSNDHRVVQAMAMLALKENKKIYFSNPSCVNKSWPQFWKFMEFVKQDCLNTSINK